MSSTPLRTYRWKAWYFAMHLLFGLLLLLAWGFMLVGILSVAQTILTTPSTTSLIVGIILLTLAPIALAWILLALWRIGYVLHAPILVFEDGLELRSWPQIRVFLRWDQLSQIPESQIQTGLLPLDTATDLPPDRIAALLRVLTKLILIPRRMPLSLVEGFPNGALADLLRHQSAQ